MMRILSVFVSPQRFKALPIAAALIASIAFLDWKVSSEIPLGFLYLFPMLMIGGACTPWEIALAGASCTFLAEAFDDFPWGLNAGIQRDILYFAAFAGVGLLMHEVTRSRAISAEHALALEGEVAARREAEEQLEILIGSSPAAILTADRNGHILLANEAAHRLFGVAHGDLRGRLISAYLPSLVNVPALESARPPFRTGMQCHGLRDDGEVFQADVWFSTYRTTAGPRLAAMVIDTSDELRTREESSFHQLSAGSRILVAAVSHEVRNVCGAIALVHENLTRSGVLTGNKDFEALGTLVLALERIAAMDLRQTASLAAATEVGPVLDELRIVIEPALRDEDVETIWSVPDDLPPVWADRQSLMQVFLNLSKNSQRAMDGGRAKRFSITALRENGGVAIRFSDTGGGVTHPDRLFRPFQQEAQATGLGLYLSRALMRSFRGDLRYEPGKDGSTFVVSLTSAAHEAEGRDEDQYAREQTGVDR